MTKPASDRALQDEIIHALADGPFRASPAWRGRGLTDPERVERYARFLARHFYYERIVHFFKYSRALTPVTGRRPEAVLRSAGFDALFGSMVLGSRESARAVAGLVVRHVAEARASVPYLSDLLRYEEAMMVVEAGPRVWGDGGSGEPSGRAGRGPEPVEGTVLLSVEYDLPAVLPKLLAPWSDPPEAPKQPTRLLVARSPEGRVAVARTTEAVAALVELADGNRTLGELAAGAGLEMQDLSETVQGLVELGALRFSAGS